MKCVFCQPEEKLILKKYKYWTALIHPYQSYLGRVRIIFNRHMVDLLDTNEKEKGELLRIMNDLKSVLNELFQPDLFNYASLGNFIRHLHIHLIPRYEGKRVFQNIEFVDKKWNDIHRPYEQLQLPREVMEELKEQMKKRLS